MEVALRANRKVCNYCTFISLACTRMPHCILLKKIRINCDFQLRTIQCQVYEYLNIQIANLTFWIGIKKKLADNAHHDICQYRISFFPPVLFARIFIIANTCHAYACITPVSVFKYCFENGKQTTCVINTRWHMAMRFTFTHFVSFPDTFMNECLYEQ